MTLNELVRESHKTAKDKGFWDKERNVGELMMLITTELGEGFEAYRCGQVLEERGLVPSDLQPDRSVVPEDEAAFKAWFESHIKGTFEEEIADTMIRLADLCGGLDIPIEEVILLKMRYNKTRERLHGKKF